MTELTDPHIEQAVAAARAVREQLGIALTAPFDRDLLRCVEQELGLCVCILAMPQKVAGAYVRRARFSKIFIQAENFPTRQRFTIAHEVGHHLLGHATVFESYEDVGRETSDPAEQQANYFAGELLQPIEAVCVELERLLPDGSAPAMIDIVRLADTFHVSPLAMLYRLSKGEFPGVDRPLLDLLWRQANTDKLHLELADQLGIGHGSDEISRCFDAGDFPRLPPGIDASDEQRIAQLVRDHFEASA